jgi:shikimate dehydrogenase
VIGHPIGHSLSPQMHNAALAGLAASDARFAEWRYLAFDIPPADLASALGLMGSHGFHGVNLTVPHKVLAVGMVASLDPAAREVGAVNTLLREGSGWKGFNTDGYGLSAGIREGLGVGLRGMPVILLGAGGAARGAAVECLRAGCAGLWIINRTRASLDSLLSHLAPIAGRIPIGAFRNTGPERDLAQRALVINATSLGLRAADPSPVDLSALPGVTAVYDMVYNPPMTKLLEQARGLGIKCANGLGMLVHQGAKALEIWTGVSAEKTAPVMRAAASKALGY